MGLDDRIEANRLEAMPEVVIEKDVNLKTSNIITGSADMSLPNGIYAGRLEMGFVGEPVYRVNVNIGVKGNGFLLCELNSGTSLKLSYAQAYLYRNEKDTTLPVPFILVSRGSAMYLEIKANIDSSSNTDTATVRSKLTLRKLI